MIVKGIFKGILVLLALSIVVQPAKVRASNSSDSDVILVVSVTDHVAFTKADTDSLKIFLKKILPNHEFVHVNANVSVEYSNIPQIHQIKEVRENIKNQIKEKILPHHKISHLILMDHGNTSWDKSASTTFRYLGAFGSRGGDQAFRKIFDHLVGKFTNDASLILESCSTVCDGAKDSQIRIQEIMNYFKIKNGTVFAAYHYMISEGYELGFYLKQYGKQIIHPYSWLAALQIALLTQVDVLFTSSQFSFLEFGMAFFGLSATSPLIIKFISFINDKLDRSNWGFLYKFKSGIIEKIYDLNYYKNKNDLFLKLEPKKIKAHIFTCSSLFM